MAAILRACALGFVLLLTAGRLAWPADRTITLEPGAEWALLIERSFETVLIGDPDVVDVHTRGDRSVVIEALKPGASNLVFVDDRNIAITNIRVLVCSAGATRTKYRDDGPDCE
jgi:Flp pilus assembly secretin CpaC